MKTIPSLVLLFFFVQTLVGQSPEKMSYQAVIRNAQNELVSDQAVGMRISILEDTPSGVEVYVETHEINTNANGLVSLEIGGGTVVAGDFSTIDWSNGSFFVKTETDPNGGTDYTISGTSQLLSVPFALHAKTASSLTGDGYTYATPQTRYYAINGSSFTKYRTAESFEIRRSFSDYPTYTAMTGGMPGQQGKLVAPLQLPDGARITNMEARFRDTDGSDVATKVDLVSVSGVSGAILGTCAAEQEGGLQDVSTVLDVTIQNQFSTYALMFTGNSGSDNNNALYFVRLTYTVDQAD